MTKTQTEEDRTPPILSDIERTVRDYKLNWKRYQSDDPFCPAMAHAHIKRAIQLGATPFILGRYAIIPL